MELTFDKCPSCGQPTIKKDKVIQYSNVFMFETVVNVMHENGTLCTFKPEFRLLYGTDS